MGVAEGSRDVIRIAYAQPTAPHDVSWFEPLAPGYLSAWLRREFGDSVEFVRVAEPHEAYGCDVLAISATSQDYERAKSFASTVRQTWQPTLTVVGGHHITFLPETLAPEFDIGVIGEGEATLADVVSVMLDADGEPWLRAALMTVPGLVCHGARGPFLTPPRRGIDPLDTIPHPDRDAVATPYLSTSRGCPYGCTFCGSRSFWRGTRFFSAEYVVDEIEQILRERPNVGYVSLQDDLFIAHRPRLERIIELLIERKLSHVKPFGFAVRANLVNDKLCESIKRIAVGGVCFGAESGSDAVLKMAGKGVTAEQNQRALDTLKRHGITCGCSFIVGFPDETEADVRSTYEFIQRNVDAGKLAAGPGTIVNVLSPLPGTRIWADALRAGKVSLDMNWSRLSGYASWRSSKHSTFDEWAAHRLRSDAVYLGSIKHERLIELMREYETKIPR